MKKFPIGIQTFERMRTEGYYYVDKTRYIAELANEGIYYFLSRPRRFGKSLFLDTLDCALSGKRTLFTGLYLHSPSSRWEWNRKSAVLKIDFSGTRITSLNDLFNRLNTVIDGWEESYSIRRTIGYPGERLLSLVPKLAEKTEEKVAILVDEYDKPIIDNIEKPEAAAEVRDGLRDFYGAIKPLDPNLRFVMLTGVSKFAKAGIFSGLNNLNDITIDSRYSTLCGYTEEELEHVFQEPLSQFDRNEVRQWYNGYSWGGKHVYNPYDILLLFSKKIFRPWWFETGTPSFLVKLLTKKPKSLPDLDRLTVGDEMLGSLEIGNLKPETLLFQAGYLTIKNWISDPQRGTVYTLGFPNREVREAFNRLMLDTFMDDSSTIMEHRTRLWKILDTADADSLRDEIDSLFSSLSHHWFTKNTIAKYEGFYASVIFAFFSSLGCETIPEDTSNQGRSDLTVKTSTVIWIFELKVISSGSVTEGSHGKSPLEQIKEKGYADKYRSDSRQIVLVGMILNPFSKSIESWETDFL